MRVFTLLPCALAVACSAWAAVSVPRLAVPLAFEPNLGQAAPEARFVAHAGTSTLLFAADEVVIAGREGSLRLRFADRPAGAPPRLVPEGELEGRSHYLIGRDPSAWRRNVPHYASLRYEEVYP